MTTKLKTTPKPDAEPRRIMISIKLRPATLEFYRSLGPGWQTVMNADLDRLARRRSNKAVK